MDQMEQTNHVEQSVRALVVGDIHVRTVEIEYTDLMLNEIIAVAIETKPSFITVLGDLLHTHGKISINPFSRVIDWLARLADISYVYVLIGNHDIIGPSLDITIPGSNGIREHAFNALHKWENVTIVDDLTSFEVNGFKFFATPFLPEKIYNEKCKDVNFQEYEACFSHTSFRGVKYTLDQEAAPCDDVWPEDRPLMIAGHIHTYQVVSKNLLYLGTPCQQTHGEDSNKAIGLFTFTKGKPYHLERIHLKTVPVRTTHTFRADDFKSIELLTEELNLSTRIRLTKVKITGTRAEITVCRKTMACVALKAIKNVSIDFKPTDDGVDIEKPLIVINSKPGSTFDQVMLDVLRDTPDLLDKYKTVMKD